MPGYDMTRPRFKAEDLDDEKQRKKIISWLIQLDEKLRYLLDNLDEENLGAELTATLEETRSAIQLTAKGLEDAQATLQLMPDQIRAAVESIDEFETSGSEILLTALMARISTPQFIVNILRNGTADTALQIDKDGAVMDYLDVVKRLTAPNMAEKYTGKTSITVGTGGDFPTLQAAFDTLNGRVITENVTIRLLNDLTENAVLHGVMGGGSVRVFGNDKTLTGSIELKHSACDLYANDITILSAGVGSGLSIEGCRHVALNDAIIDGRGLVRCVAIFDGSAVTMEDCELYNATNLIDIEDSALHATDLSGGSCTNYLAADRAVWTWEGTKPNGNYLEAGASIYNNNATSASGGTTPTPAPGPVTTITRTAMLSGTWYGSGWMSGNELRQGKYGDGNHRGLMWFDLSALSGNVKNASLQLTRRSRVGRSGTVTVTLYQSTASGKSGEPAISGGVDLGEIASGETRIFSIPEGYVALGSALALAVAAPDDVMMPGRDYSENYAAFDGTDGSAPVLTVTYQ